MRTLAALVAITGLAWIAGCNTIQGMGKDLQAFGNALEKAVHR